MFRIGQGYDVHRLNENRALIIGGEKIPYEKGLLGHSDADVLTHAIMDAILGACAMGDIGALFPDNDPEYEGANSMKLLSEVCRIVHEKGFKIANIDCTVIAQRPKINPYVMKIRENYSEVTGLAVEAISVKATTEEGLGFTGRGEAIAAQAVCLVETL